MHNMLSLCSDRGEQKERWPLHPNTSEQVNLRNFHGNPGLRGGDECSRASKRKREKGEGNLESKRTIGREGFLPTTVFVPLHLELPGCDVHIPHLMCARHLC